MIFVRAGTLINPETLRDTIANIKGITEFRIIFTKEDDKDPCSMDKLLIKIGTPDYDEKEVEREVIEAARQAVEMRPDVIFVPPLRDIRPQRCPHGDAGGGFEAEGVESFRSSNLPTPRGDRASGPSPRFFFFRCGVVPWQMHRPAIYPTGAVAVKRVIRRTARYYFLRYGDNSGPAV